MHAQLPFYTDDTGVTDAGKWHFEFFNEYDALQLQYPDVRQNTANFKINRGLPHHLELDLDVPYLAIGRAGGNTPSSGVGDTNLGIKWAFHEHKPGSFIPSLATSLYIEFPTGDSTQQLGSGLADYWLNVASQTPLSDKTRLTTNLGMLFAGNTSTGVIGTENSRGQVYTGGISYLHDFSKRLTLGVEAYGGYAETQNWAARSCRRWAAGSISFAMGLRFALACSAGSMSPVRRSAVRSASRWTFPTFGIARRSTDRSRKDLKPSSFRNQDFPSRGGSTCHASRKRSRIFHSSHCSMTKRPKCWPVRLSSRRMAPRERIYKEGDPGTQAYVVIGGRVSVTAVDADHQQVVIDEPGHGEFFGFASMLEQSAHRTSAMAIEPSECLEISRDDITVLLTRKPMAGMDLLTALGRQFHQTQGLVQVRANRSSNEMIEEEATRGEKVADGVARFGGSWTFIITFSVFLIIYTAINVFLDKNAWDPYPFILLNLFLSMLAAVQAPVIMMSQNRQDTKDRLRAELDFDVNRRAEKEIQGLSERLHVLNAKIDDVTDLLRNKAAETR